MAKYKILAQEVTGVKGSRYFKGQVVDDKSFEKGTIEDLVNAKAIAPVEKEAKADKETK